MFNLTIITAAWRAQNLPEVIKSIDNQTMNGFQHIIINDNNQEVRESMKPLCDGINRHWIDLGVRTHYYGALARNIGTQVAFCYVHHSKRDIDNEWVCFHDDDNLWQPYHLESMIRIAQTHSEASMILSDIEKVGANNQDWKQIIPCRIKHGYVDLGQIMYKTRLFREYGYFFPNPRRKQKYDFDLIKKMVDGEGDKVFFTHQPTFIMSYRKK
jgi:glycosyltransferase involved in cell wall biosynthesis